MSRTSRPSPARRAAAVITMVLVVVVGAVVLTVFLLGNLGYLLLAWAGLIGGSVAVSRALRSSGATQRLWLFSRSSGSHCWSWRYLALEPRRRGSWPLS